MLTGDRIEAKAAFARAQFEAGLPARPGGAGLVAARRRAGPDAETEAGASVLLRCQALDPSPDVVGRAFSGAAVEMALSGYPGFHLTAPPGNGSPFGVYTAAYVPQTEVPHVAVLPDGTRVDVAPPRRAAARGAARRTSRSAHVAGQSTTSADPPAGRRSAPWPAPAAATRAGRRTSASGPASDDAAAWLAATLTPERIRELLPEAADLPVAVHPLPNLRAVNVVIEGLLGQGVAASTRFDPQGKAVGEWLLSRTLEIPEALL